MDRIEQRLRVAPNAPPPRSPVWEEQPLGTPLALDMSPNSLGSGDTVPDAEAVIFSILPILAILSCCCRSAVAVPRLPFLRLPFLSILSPLQLSYWLTPRESLTGKCSRRYRVSSEYRCNDVPSPSQMQCVRFG